MIAPARVIPCLQLASGGLYKTTRFNDPQYVGDPINAVRVFDGKEVDELVLLDIEATAKNRPVDFGTIEEIVSEAFMPVCYGGGIRSLDDLERVFAVGVEKVAMNTSALVEPDLISLAAERYGSQSVVVSIDVLRRGNDVFVRNAVDSRSRQLEPVAWAKRCQEQGAGELLLTSVDREGTREGYDLELVSAVASAVSIPIVANGGAGTLDHLRDVLAVGADGAVAGSMFVFQGPRRAVLISYLSPEERLALS